MTGYRSNIIILLGLISIYSVGCKQKQNIAKEYPAEVTALATEGGRGLPYYVGQDLRPAWNLKDAPPPRTLEEFKLTDQNGKIVSRDTLRGKIAVVSFFFTECPGICPMVTKNLLTVQDQFQNDSRVVMISISITPERDTPFKLQGFASKHGISSKKWRLLTGNRQEIYQLARNSFNADTFSERENKVQALKAGDFLHSENVYLLDGDLRVRGIYQGRMISSLQELTRDAKTLLQ